MTRESLPPRRFAENISFTIGRIPYVATLGFHEDGRIGEVFVAGPKSGSDAEINASDAAAILSIAMQHGVNPEVFRHAVKRDSRGIPTGPIGVVVDLLAGGEGE